MILNYIKTAFRSFLRNYVFSLINIIGLSVGLTASILILLYVYNELNYDTFNKHADRIYRVNTIFVQKDSEELSGVTTGAMGPSLFEEFPEVENFVRFSMSRPGNFRSGEESFKIQKVMYADSSVFDVFTFDILSGNKSALTKPFSIVLTSTTAQKIFGDTDPIGKVLEYNNELPLTVMGIVEDLPPNSHLEFEALISFHTLYTFDKVYLNWDGGFGYYTYVLLDKANSSQKLSSKLKPFLHRHINYKYEQVGVELKMVFDPLLDIHLFSDAEDNLETRGNLINVYVFSAIAFFILAIACINYMNLSTARSSRRAREVGVRKVLGATSSGIRMQFLSESMIISFFALLLALIFVEVIQPFYNELINQDLSLYSTQNLMLISYLIILTILVGFLSGSYPAFYLSSFKPVHVLKGGWISAKAKAGFRNILVSLQFAISICLIICTLVIYKQLGFVHNKELGFNKENILYIPLESNKSKESLGLLKNEISRIPTVQSVAASTGIPGLGLSRNGYFPEGYEEPMMIYVIAVDESFIETFDLKLIEGQNFSRLTTLDDGDYLVNKSLANEVGWVTPIGREIRRNGKHKVIGMIEDFHFAPLFIKIAPLIITNQPFDGFDYLIIKQNGNNLKSTIHSIEKEWKKVLPMENFNYHFLDHSLDVLYNSERRFGNIFIIFSLLAIFIACLGLLGLSSFLVEQRTREIGVRKVFGSSSASIIRLMNLDFAKRVIIANIFAWPVAWYVMNMWLNNFAFRTALSWWVFPVSGLIVLVIAFITVTYQSFRAANTNPADVIKYE